MNSPNPKSDRDSKGLEALIAALLHQEATPVDSAIVAKYMNGDFVLTPDEERALTKIVPNFMPGCGKTAFDSVVREAPADAFVALHRNKPASGFTAKTTEELSRKRLELQAKIRQKREARES